MKNNQSNTLYFYQVDKLARVTQGDNVRSVLRYQEQPLAEIHTAYEVGVSRLLASDTQDSVLSIKAPDESSMNVYTPYGYSESASHNSLIGYAGQPDMALGFYLLGNGYRAFNSAMMRFQSPDSLSPFEKGGINAYCYCIGDPVNNTDPDGHAILPWGLRKLFRSAEGKSRHYEKIQNRSIQTQNGTMTTILYKEKYDPNANYLNRPSINGTTKRYRDIGDIFDSAGKRANTAAEKALAALAGTGKEPRLETKNPDLLNKYSALQETIGPLPPKMSSRQKALVAQDLIAGVRRKNLQSATPQAHGLTMFNVNRSQRYEP